MLQRIPDEVKLMPKLEVLSLTKNKIEDASAAALVPGLKREDRCHRA